MIEKTIFLENKIEISEFVKTCDEHVPGLWIVQLPLRYPGSCQDGISWPFFGKHAWSGLDWPCAPRPKWRKSHGLFCYLKKFVNKNLCSHFKELYWWGCVKNDEIYINLFQLSRIYNLSHLPDLVGLPDDILTIFFSLLFCLFLRLRFKAD